MPIYILDPYHKHSAQIHPKARCMVPHNRRWIYVFYIDRILPERMNKG